MVVISFAAMPVLTPFANDVSNVTLAGPLCITLNRWRTQILGSVWSVILPPYCLCRKNAVM
ncbi:uncharacterized protein DEA37_0012570 [Paragonimus westermani]|uniref:Uncharacterized protein n=1 Tax=Paragonimus westermani TaxID=34504 RepID=A0A5J4NEQ0_9TREM|nr:uncharacterized protein DEA37_0012570 [Paragonimus westermani]